MKKYFEINGYYVTDHGDIDFAKYAVFDNEGRKRNRVFDEIRDAAMYCIGLSNGCEQDNKLMILIESFNLSTTTIEHYLKG